MNAYYLVLIMTTDYELYLNFKFLNTYFFLLLLNNQQKHCVSCKVIVISRYTVSKKPMQLLIIQWPVYCILFTQCFDGVTLLTTVHL